VSREIVQEEPVSKEVKNPPETQDDILYLAARDMLSEEQLAELDQDKLAAALRGEEVDDLSKEDDTEAEAEDDSGKVDEYSGMNVDQLRAELSSRGLQVSGLKEELQQRLRDDDAGRA
jgi:SAP domain